MRSFSIKSSVLALVLALGLSTASPALAAARQSRDRERGQGPVQRIVQLVKRFIGMAMDEIIPPHPESNGDDTKP